MKVICESCQGRRQKSDKEIRYTFRNGSLHPLCKACWKAALQIQFVFQPENRAEAARMRFLVKRLRGEVK